jgi:serine/threonine protein phosphatase PrpC
VTGRVRFEISSRSEPGGHAHNEDAFATRVLAGDPPCCLCVVADGQGGHRGWLQDDFTLVAIQLC